ncbi:MAG: hypothetical protein AAF206_28375, partial [Bacteroidota bacterium]
MTNSNASANTVFINPGLGFDFLPMQSLMSVHFPLLKTEQQNSLKAISDKSDDAVNAIFVTLYGGSDSDNLLQPYYDDVTGGLILLEVGSFSLSL